MKFFEEVNEKFKLNFKNNAEIYLPSLCKMYQISEDMIERHVEEINLKTLALCQKLSDEFLENHYNEIGMEIICKYQEPSEEFLERHFYGVIWNIISSRSYISEEFIEKHYEHFDEVCLTASRPLSEEFLERHFEDFKNAGIAKYQKLSEEFIERHKDELNLYMISKFQKLSESFIKKHMDCLCMGYIFEYGKISEDFLIEILNKNENILDDYLMNDIICKYQPLSYSFIKRFSHKLHLLTIYKFQKVPSEILHKIESNNIYETDVANNWIYKSVEEKKQAVIDTELYECHEYYFIAYKAIRSDRYSMYNFQYKYEKDGTYESWCDCSEDENSFGLSVGTQNYVDSYRAYDFSSIVVRCKVRYEDVGRVVHDGQKIRCFKIKVLD